MVNAKSTGILTIEAVVRDKNGNIKDTQTQKYEVYSDGNLYKYR